jgi:hypothetical protein
MPPEAERRGRVRDVSLSQVAWFGSLVGGAAFYGSLGLFVAGGFLTKGNLPAIEWFSSNPDLFRLAYLLQALAFMAWIAVPIAIWDRFRHQFFGWSTLSAVAGILGWFWRSQVDFAKAGSVGFLAEIFRSQGETDRIFASNLNEWAQMAVFGGVWELASNALAYGVWVLLVGITFLGAGHRKIGVCAICLGILDTVLLGGLGFFIAPVYLILVSGWLCRLVAVALPQTTHDIV